MIRDAHDGHPYVAVAPVDGELAQFQLGQLVRAPLVVAPTKRLLRPLTVVLAAPLRRSTPRVMLEVLMGGEPVRLPLTAESIKDAMVVVVKDCRRVVPPLVLMTVTVAWMLRTDHRPEMIVALPTVPLVRPLLAPLRPVLQVLLVLTGSVEQQRRYKPLHVPPLIRLTAAILPTVPPLLVPWLLPHHLRRA